MMILAWKVGLISVWAETDDMLFEVLMPDKRARHFTLEITTRGVDGLQDLAMFHFDDMFQAIEAAEGIARIAPEKE